MKNLLINIKTFFTMLRQLMSILDKKQRIQCVFLLFGVFICAMLETLGVSSIIPFILVLFSPDQMMENKYVKMVSGFFGITTYLRLLILTAIIIGLVYIVKNLSLIIFQYFQSRLHNEIEKDLLIRQYGAFMKRPYSYYLRINTSEVMRGVSNDITQVAQVIDGFIGLTSEVVTLLMIGIFIVIMDPFVALGLVGSALLVALLFVYGFKSKTSSLGSKCREIFYRRSKIVLESVGGYKDISIFQKKDYFIDEYAKVNKEACKYNTQYLLIMRVPARAIETIFIICLLTLACIKVGLGDGNSEFVSLMGVLAMASVRVLPSISSISGYMNTLIYNREGLESAYNNIEGANRQAKKESEDKDLSVADGHSLTVKKLSENEKDSLFKDKLSLKKITFRYDNTDIDILKDLTVDIKKNEAVAFIGESGAGKSTLLDVLLGLLKPQNGGVFLDDTNIEDIPYEWSDVVGYVPQSIFLLDNTVRRNIAFGIKDEDIDDDKIWECLKEAQLYDFIKELPAGLDTTVGERGVRFSGGQRQRLAIARALYHDPQILVLDEATSALDNETEKEVMAAIESFMGKLTIIIVAHRLTTIENCDKVYELEKGVLKENK